MPPSPAMDRASGRASIPPSSEQPASSNSEKQLTHVVKLCLWKNPISKARLISNTNHVRHDCLQSKHWCHHRMSSQGTVLCCFTAARRLCVISMTNGGVPLRQAWSIESTNCNRLQVSMPHVNIVNQKCWQVAKSTSASPLGKQKRSRCYASSR